MVDRAGFEPAIPLKHASALTILATDRVAVSNVRAQSLGTNAVPDSIDRKLDEQVLLKRNRQKLSARPHSLADPEVAFVVVRP